jgi:hypothetical protein
MSSLHNGEEVSRSNCKKCVVVASCVLTILESQDSSSEELLGVFMNFRLEASYVYDSMNKSPGKLRRFVSSRVNLRRFGIYKHFEHHAFCYIATTDK